MFSKQYHIFAAHESSLQDPSKNPEKDTIYSIEEEIDKKLSTIEIWSLLASFSLIPMFMQKRGSWSKVHVFTKIKLCKLIMHVTSNNFLLTLENG